MTPSITVTVPSGKVRDVDLVGHGVDREALRPVPYGDAAGLIGRAINHGDRVASAVSHVDLVGDGIHRRLVGRKADVYCRGVIGRAVDHGDGPVAHAGRIVTAKVGHIDFIGERIHSYIVGVLSRAATVVV